VLGWSVLGWSGTDGLSRGAVVDRGVLVLVVAGPVAREHGAAPLTGPPARGPGCDRSCAILIVDLFLLLISDACHAWIVILDTIKPYSCNGSQEWAETLGKKDQPAQAIATATSPSAALMLNDLVICPGQKPTIAPRRLLSVGRGHSHLAGRKPPTSFVPRMSSATTSAADLSIAGSALV
jgi:hypothetical protein